MYYQPIYIDACDTALQRLYPNSPERSITMKWETWSWNCNGAVQNLHQRVRRSSHKSDMNNPKKSGSAGNATRNLNCEVFIRVKGCLVELWVEGTVVQNLTHVISRVNARRSWAWLYSNHDSNFHRTRQCIRSFYLNNQIASRRDWKTLRRVSNYSALSESRSYKKSKGENLLYAFGLGREGSIRRNCQNIAPLITWADHQCDRSWSIPA